MICCKGCGTWVQLTGVALVGKAVADVAIVIQSITLHEEPSSVGRGQCAVAAINAMSAAQAYEKSASARRADQACTSRQVSGRTSTVGRTSGPTTQDYIRKYQA